MAKKSSPKETGISSITGKNVVIRHATEADIAFIRDQLVKYDLFDEVGGESQYVVAAEDDEIIGFGRLRKTGGVYDVGCIVVVEHRRRKGIGASIIKHLIEYAPVKMIYVITEQAAYFKKLGFVEVKDRPAELAPILDFECSVRGKRSTLLMAYEK
jgi:N-acetylglutamate synthase-like GNAT family acetyltransferase